MKQWSGINENIAIQIGIINNSADSINKCQKNTMFIIKQALNGKQHEK